MTISGNHHWPLVSSPDHAAAGRVYTATARCHTLRLGEAAAAAAAGTGSVVCGSIVPPVARGSRASRMIGGCEDGTR